MDKQRLYALRDAGELARTNLPLFAQKYLIIKDLKSKQFSYFTFNPIQRDLYEKHFQFFEVKPIRLYILKYRQTGGFSTFGSAFAFAYIYAVPGLEFDFFAQTDKYCISFDERFNYFNSNLPESIKHDTDNFLTRIKSFPAMGSKITLRAAGGAGKRASFQGRGPSLSGFWGSEVSFWANQEETINSSVPAVQFEPFTFVVFETTAGTQGDTFHTGYREAKYGRSNYDALFYAWHSNPLHRVPLAPGEVLELTNEELKAQKTHHLDMEQMKWRRRTIQSFAGENVDSPLRAFKRDFPEDDMSCFVSSSFPFFDLDTIERHHGYILENQIKPLTGSPQWTRFYYMPKPGRKYSIGVDTSEGLEHGDFDAASVKDNENGEQVAVIHGRMDMAVFAKLINDVGRFYNNALAVVERKDTGIYIIRKLQEEYKYPEMYVTGKSRRGAREIDNIGWIPTGGNKRQLLQEYKDRLDNDESLPNDEETIDELSFFEDRKKKLGASGKNHDDLVIADALADEGRKQSRSSIQVYTSRTARSDRRFSKQITLMPKQESPSTFEGILQ